MKISIFNGTENQTYNKKELDDMKISYVASSDNRTYNNDITQIYTKQSSEYYNELTNSGMKKYSKQEFEEIANTFTARLETAQSESLENNVDLEF